MTERFRSRSVSSQQVLVQRRSPGFDRIGDAGNLQGFSASCAFLLGFDRNPSAISSRIRAALEASGCAREISPEFANMARALAASKAAGTFLCIGEGAGEVAGSILDGMDHSSGLVVLVQDKHEAAVLARELDCDVRASVHRQDVASFLIDVRRHRFNLIVDLITNEHPRSLRIGLGLLEAGGVYLAYHFGDLPHESPTACDQETDEQPAPLDPEDFEVARLGEQPDSMIIVRRTERTGQKRRSRTPIR